jgi:putative transposase
MDNFITSITEGLRNEIFFSTADYKRFTDLLYLSNSSRLVNVRDIRKENASIYDFDRGDALVAIGAYCLMPNHFHILLTPVSDEGVSRFMNKLGTSYSMYFNKRYERTGSLFEGTYKSRWADSDVYLKYLYAYIHLNPLKLIQPDWKTGGVSNRERAKEYLDSYSFSSLLDYFKDRPESAIVDTTKFPEYFTSRKEIDNELLSWLSYDELLIPG